MHRTGFRCNIRTIRIPRVLNLSFRCHDCGVEYENRRTKQTSLCVQGFGDNCYVFSTPQLSPSTPLGMRSAPGTLAGKVPPPPLLYPEELRSKRAGAFGKIVTNRADMNGTLNVRDEMSHSATPLFIANWDSLG